MYKQGLSVLLACTVLLRSSLVCVTAGDYPDWPELVAAKKFCASPDFKTLKCGFATKAEWDAAVPGQFLRGSIISGALAGSTWQPMPLTLSQGGKSYWSYAVDAISLACKGPVVVRFVFKILTQPDQSQNCSLLWLTPEADFAVTDLKPKLKDIPVVRCELQLPEGRGNETERALKAKEGPCYICSKCSAGGGCPANTGTWYSEVYVTDVGGCDAVYSWYPPGTKQETYRPRGAAVVVNPDIEALVMKFEVCNSPGCFDAAYEAQKLESAKKCVGGVC